MPIRSPTTAARSSLVLDQFEELWTLAEPIVRDRLLEALVSAATENGSRLRLVTTIRADFYDRPLSHPIVGPLIEAASYPLAPLQPAELERAMSAPAARVGVRLEPALVAELTAAVSSQPAGLPLLQYALTELFDERVGATMTLASYEAMGGVAGALTGRAEAILAGLRDADRPAVRRLFRRLVVPGEGTEDTRRRVVRGELARVPAAVIDAYGEARLLTFDLDPVTREPTVEVAHEALIRHWPRLRTWLDDDREGLRVHRHLTDAAAVWSARGRDSGDLYRGARLQTAASWAAHHDADLTPNESSFLDQAQRRVRGARRWRLAAVSTLSLLLVAAILAAGLAIVQRRRADHNATAASTNAAAAQTAAAVADQRADEAADAAARETRTRTESQLRSLAFEAQSIATSYPDLAMLLAVEAYRRQPGVASESALYASLVSQPAIRRFIDVELPTDAVVQHMVASAAGLVALDLGGTVAMLDASTLRLTGVTMNVGGRAILAFNRTGDELATSTPAGQIRRWDPSTGREVAPLVQVQPLVTGDAPPVAYLPDGALVVADGGVLGVVPPGAGSPTRQVSVRGAAIIAALAVNPSGTTIAASWRSGPTLRKWCPRPHRPGRPDDQTDRVDVRTLRRAPVRRRPPAVRRDGATAFQRLHRRHRHRDVVGTPARRAPEHADRPPRPRRRGRVGGDVHRRAGPAAARRHRRRAHRGARGDAAHPARRRHRARRVLRAPGRGRPRPAQPARARAARRRPSCGRSARRQRPALGAPRPRWRRSPWSTARASCPSDPASSRH